MHIFDCHYVLLFMPLLECEISLPMAFNVAGPLIVKHVCHLGIGEHDTMFFVLKLNQFS